MVVFRIATLYEIGHVVSQTSIELDGAAIFLAHLMIFEVTSCNKLEHPANQYFFFGFFDVVAHQSSSSFQSTLMQSSS